jgi:hypothetical protein
MGEFATRNVFIHLPELAKAIGREDAGVVVAVPDLAAECGCTCSCTCSPSGGGCVDIADEVQLREMEALKDALRRSIERLG